MQISSGNNLKKDAGIRLGFIKLYPVSPPAYRMRALIRLETRSALIGEASADLRETVSAWMKNLSIGIENRPIIGIEK
jgi:hypothetical protein